jgi:hypothetical protein
MAAYYDRDPVRLRELVGAAESRLGRCGLCSRTVDYGDRCAHVECPERRPLTAAPLIATSGTVPARRPAE